MKCSKCQTEFEGSICPNCGTAVIETPGNAPEAKTTPQQQNYPTYQQFKPDKPKKKKKPFYKRWWFILIVIIAVIAIAGKISSAVKENEKIVWADMILGDILPQPPKDRGVVHTNSQDNLWVDINRISEKQYAEYTESCKDSGFTIDGDSGSTHYSAYNESGNKLDLNYNESDKIMTIDLSAPMEFSKINWPESEAGKLLPVPKSLMGNFSYEQEDGFSVYISGMTKDDYNDYVTECSEKGFNADYDKSDGYYSAKNADGWDITVKYEGFNIISISISAPDEESVETTQPAEEDTTQAQSTTAAENNSGDIDPDFKAAMDSYEEFMNEYVEFMKKYNESGGSDPSILADYADYMKKYAQFAEDFEKWGNEDLNAAETAYYIDVQARVSQKLLEISE